MGLLKVYKFILKVLAKEVSLKVGCQENSFFLLVSDLILIESSSIAKFNRKKEFFLD